MNAKELSAIFRSSGRTLGAVESLTGGLFCETITSVPGASHFFKGGIVTYMTEEKVRLLNVSYEEVDKYGVVSEQIASLMASRGARMLSTDYCVSFTGNAGPETMEGKPVGTVYIGFYCYNKVSVYHFELKGTRDEIRKECVDRAIDILAQLISTNN